MKHLLENMSQSDKPPPNMQQHTSGDADDFFLLHGNCKSFLPILRGRRSSLRHFYCSIGVRRQLVGLVRVESMFDGKEGEGKESCCCCQKCIPHFPPRALWGLGREPETLKVYV